MKKSHYIVILAGGKGERLWPLSREKMPKQLLTLGNKHSLLEQTIARVKSLVPKSNLLIMTTEQQEEEIKRLVGHEVNQVLTEPCARNTAPAILLACLQIFEKDKDATIVFLPADHFIIQDALFRIHLKKALDFSAHNEVFSLVGIKPNFAATGYGYIEYEEKKTAARSLNKVSHFHEKPSLKIAKLYISLSNMLWNIGVFCGKASLFINEYKNIIPTLFNAVMKYHKGDGNYQNCESISFDHAVLEKSKKIFVEPADFSWSDVGNLEIFLSIRAQHQQVNAPVININSKNNIVDVPKKLVGLIGIEDLCIVETDDVLLISKKKQTDNVKLILNKLKDEKQNHYL